MDNRSSCVARWLIGGACATLACLAISGLRLEAHKSVTSKFTYYEDVLPIVRSRCLPCHMPGGPSPMSLVSYEDALPWAESLRQELIAEKMPPWYVDENAPRVLGGA